MNFHDNHKICVHCSKRLGLHIVTSKLVLGVKETIYVCDLVEPLVEFKAKT